MTRDELFFLDPTDPEWARAWEALAAHRVNVGLLDPKRATNFGESWQYMGSCDGMHEFRHRYHPRSRQREYVRIPITERTPA